MGTEVRESKIRVEFVGGEERRTRLLVDDMDGQPPWVLYEGPPMRESHNPSGLCNRLWHIVWGHILGREADAMRAVLDPLVDMPEYVDFRSRKEEKMGTDTELPEGVADSLEGKVAKDRAERVDRITQAVEACLCETDALTRCKCGDAIAVELDAERIEERKRVAQAFEVYWWGEEIPWDLRAVGDFIRKGGKKHER